MTAPIALQLYSVREQLAQDPHGTLEQVARMGYTAVETGAFAGDPETQRRLFDEFGLQVVSAHMPPPIGDATADIIAAMNILGTKRLVVPWLDPQKYYHDLRGVQAAADLLNEAAEVCAANDLQLFYHNHDFELNRIDDELAFDLLLVRLDPAIRFEIDTYWVQVAGADAANVVADLGAFAPLLHIKDGPLDKNKAMLPVGEGKMDIRRVIEAGKDHTEWLIVELDRFDGDMLQAVAQSLDYLVLEKLGRAN
jgi:sugar phosphate isomerase/epimerase